MNVSKLKQGTGPRDRNAQTVVQSDVQAKRRMIEYGDITEDEYYDLVRERDVLAQEVQFNRTSADYSAHCFQLLSKYEKYSVEFLDSLQQQYDSAAKTTVALHAAIFEEVEVTCCTHTEKKR